MHRGHVDVKVCGRDALLRREDTVSPFDSIPIYIDRFAPQLVAIGILSVVARYLGWKIP